jgi:hypothetical protein
MSGKHGAPASASLKAIAKVIEASAKAGAEVLEASAKAGAEALQSLYGSAPGALTEVLEWASSQNMGGGCCSCEIPPPCWMPRPLCDVVSYGKAGNTASITFAITNDSMTNRIISVFTTTPLPGLTFSAPHLVLGPMARGYVEVSYTIPATLTAGPGTEIWLWIEGCRLHFLRWTIKLGPISANTNYEVCVHDGPDYLHHWYDHFYCPRPCLPEQRVSSR